MHPQYACGKETPTSPSLRGSHVSRILPGDSALGSEKHSALQVPVRSPGASGCRTLLQLLGLAGAQD